MMKTQTSPYLNALMCASDVSAVKEEVYTRYHLPTRVAIAGAAAHGERIADQCLDAGIEVVAIYDGNKGVVGKYIEGVQVSPVEAYDGTVPIILCSHRLLPLLQQLNCPLSQAIPFPALAVLDFERFPPHPFYNGLQDDMFNNRHKIQKLASYLQDEWSQQTLDAVVGFRTTLDPQNLKDVVVDDEYLAKDCLPLHGQEVMIDGGSYTGDTIAAFTDRVKGGFKKILAFEPDPRSYAFLEKYAENDSRILCSCAGLYREDSHLSFDSNGREDATFTAGGSDTVAVKALDRMSEAAGMTFLRLNIEGAEIDALEGAKQRIINDRPKMAIAVYHRPDHLWKIPEWIRETVEDYQFFLRQHDGGLVETVLYAIPSEMRNG